MAMVVVPGMVPGWKTVVAEEAPPEKFTGLVVRVPTPENSSL